MKVYEVLFYFRDGSQPLKLYIAAKDLVRLRRAINDAKPIRLENPDSKIGEEFLIPAGSLLYVRAIEASTNLIPWIFEA